MDPYRTWVQSRNVYNHHNKHLITLTIRPSYGSGGLTDRRFWLPWCVHGFHKLFWIECFTLKDPSCPVSGCDQVLPNVPPLPAHRDYKQYQSLTRPNFQGCTVRPKHTKLEGSPRSWIRLYFKMNNIFGIQEKCISFLNNNVFSFFFLIFVFIH